MEPTQQQPKQRRPEQPQPQPQPSKAGPKVALAELDARFVADMDNPALSGATRTFAGRMHQLVLHLQVTNDKIDALARGREADARHVMQAFEQLIAQIPGLQAAATVPPEPEVRPPSPGEAAPVAPEAPSMGHGSAPPKLANASAPPSAVVASAPPPPKAGKKH